MWARVHFVWVLHPCTVRSQNLFTRLQNAWHDVVCFVFWGFLLYFCLFFNLQSVLFSLHHLFGFIGSTASLIFCTCFAFVFHMKCVFIWNLAIFIFYLKNFHMKWFFLSFSIHMKMISFFVSYFANALHLFFIWNLLLYEI